VPHIKEIVRIPKEPTQPLGKFKRKRSAPPRSKSKTAESHESSDEEEAIDKDTDQSGIVLDFPSRDEVERREFTSMRLSLYLIPASGVAFTSGMVIPKAAANSEWYFQKIFGDGDFIAAGQLLIPPQVKKPGKGTKDNTYVRGRFPFYFCFLTAP
jgi:centromere protein C